MALIDSRLSELYLSVFPYDIVYIATHGSQVKGVKNKYEVEDSDGNSHELTIKFAEGFSGAAICLDSVDGTERGSGSWTERHANIWGKFLEEYSKTKDLPPPISSEPTKVRMRQLMLGEGEEGLLSPIGFDRLALGRRPLVIVNACGSWSDLSARFIYAGATAFVGTLWPITDSVATEFSSEFFNRLFDEKLVDAFNQAKGKMIEEADRMAYVFSGTFENVHDPGAQPNKSAIPVLVERLERSINRTNERISGAMGDSDGDDMIERIKAEEVFLNHELEEFNGVLDKLNKLDDDKRP